MERWALILVAGMFADKVQGRPGRGGNVFEFYDCGLASILEALDKRTAPAPQP